MLPSSPPNFTGFSCHHNLVWSGINFALLAAAAREKYSVLSLPLHLILLLIFLILVLTTLFLTLSTVTQSFVPFFVCGSGDIYNFIFTLLDEEESSLYPFQPFHPPALFPQQSHQKLLVFSSPLKAQRPSLFQRCDRFRATRLVEKL